MCKLLNLKSLYDTFFEAIKFFIKANAGINTCTSILYYKYLYTHLPKLNCAIRVHDKDLSISHSLFKSCFFYSSVFELSREKTNNVVSEQV